LKEEISSSNHFPLPGVCEAYDYDDTPHQPSDAFSFLHFHFSSPQRRAKKMNITVSKEATYHCFFHATNTVKFTSNNMDASSKQHDTILSSC